MAELVERDAAIAKVMDLLEVIGAAPGSSIASALHHAADELRALPATRPPASGVAEEPTEAMIEAGMDVLEKADEDMSVENYIAGVTPDWDYGMEAEAVWRAMFAAALASGARP